MRAFRRCVLAVGVLLALAVPAGAEPLPPTLRTEQVFFHCGDGAKVQNASVAQGFVPTWDTKLPAQSVQEGAGCGQYDNILSGGINNNADALWAGTFTGNLDSFNVQLHRMGDTVGATAPDLLSVTLTIDGVVRYEGDVTGNRVVNNMGVTHEVSFGFRNVNLKSEEGDGVTEHTVQLMVASYNETQSMWVYDTTEVPAGITFNPSKLAAGAIRL